jgi:hypothetical protein
MAHDVSRTRRASLDTYRARRKQLEGNMNTVGASRSRQRRKRLDTVVGVAAMTMTAVATIVIGAPIIGIAAPPDEIATSCPVAGQCVQQVSLVPDVGAPLAHR